MKLIEKLMAEKYNRRINAVVIKVWKMDRKKKQLMLKYDRI